MSIRIEHRESKVNKRTRGVEAQELKRRVERRLWFDLEYEKLREENRLREAPKGERITMNTT